MILWFLRLFPTFRNLESRLEEVRTARIKAEDESRLWRVTVDKLASKVEELQHDKENLHQMVTDWICRWNNLKPIFNPESEPPTTAGDVPPMTRKRTARDALNDLQYERMQFQKRKAEELLIQLQNQAHPEFQGR